MDNAGNAGQGQDEDDMAGEEQGVQSEDEAVDGEDSNEIASPQGTRNGSPAFRVELDRATRRHEHEMEGLREQGLDTEEEPQILREASLEREMERYAAEKRGRRGN